MAHCKYLPALMLLPAVCWWARLAPVLVGTPTSGQEARFQPYVFFLARCVAAAKESGAPPPHLLGEGEVTCIKQVQNELDNDSACEQGPEWDVRAVGAQRWQWLPNGGSIIGSPSASARSAVRAGTLVLLVRPVRGIHSTVRGSQDI